MTAYNRKTVRGAVLLMLLLAAAAFPAMALDKWEQKADGSWYFYVLPDTEESAAGETATLSNIPEAGTDGAESGLYTGWMQAGDDVWYYIDHSRMMTGWIVSGGKFYYLGDDGIMLRNQWVGNFYVGDDGAVLTDTTTPDEERVAKNGSWIRAGKPVEKLNDKTELYVEYYKKDPYVTAEFSAPDGGSAQFTRDSNNGYSFVIFKAVKLFVSETGARLYVGDGAFAQNAVLERKNADGTIRKVHPDNLLEEMFLSAARIYMDPAGMITYVSAGNN